MATQPPSLDSAQHRIGLGLAALGRPGYITADRERDLPAGRSVDAMRRRTHKVLDRAYAGGVRYFDAARSYGRAEEFLAEWLNDGEERPGVVVGSKWGYTYAANWQIEAEQQEVKDHSSATFVRQLAESQVLLGAHLNLYQVHSVTMDSPALTDVGLHKRLAALAAEGVMVGITTSGPSQADSIRAALEVSVGGAPLYRSVQATWNLLEPSAGAALAEAHGTGCMVIVKEALANGRLVRPDTRLEPLVTPLLAPLAEETDTSYDAIALAAALQQPWSDVVLAGAVTTPQLDSNLRAPGITLAPDQLATLVTDLVESPATYWTRRARLPWN